MCVRSVYYPRWVVGKAGTTTDSKQIGRPRAPHVAEIRVLVLKAHAGGFEINMGLLCQARGKLGRAAQGQTCQDLVRQALNILPRRLIDAKEQGSGYSAGSCNGSGDVSEGDSAWDGARKHRNGTEIRSLCVGWLRAGVQRD